MHEFLPAKQILHRRHIERIAACEVCGAERETIRHVLLECTVAKVFWEHTKKLAGVKLPHLHQDTWARDLLLAKVYLTCCVECGRYGWQETEDAMGKGPFQCSKRCSGLEIQPLISGRFCIARMETGRPVTC